MCNMGGFTLLVVNGNKEVWITKLKTLEALWGKSSVIYEVEIRDRRDGQVVIKKARVSGCQKSDVSSDFDPAIARLIKNNDWEKHPVVLMEVIEKAQEKVVRTTGFPLPEKMTRFLRLKDFFTRLFLGRKLLMRAAT